MSILDSIDDFLPKYLSEPSANELKEELRKFPTDGTKELSILRSWLLKQLYFRAMALSIFLITMPIHKRCLMLVDSIV